MSSNAAVWSPAGFWIRSVALFIDAVIIGVVLSPATQYQQWVKDNNFQASAVSFVIWGLYGALCNLWFQGSIGKKVLNLKIVSAEDGSPVPFHIVFFRDGIGRFVSLLPLGFGFLWAAFNSEKKSLHDHIFATRVVKKVPVAAFGDK